MKAYTFYFILVVWALFGSCNSRQSDDKFKNPAWSGRFRNPIIPGYYANPSLVYCDGIYYLYATIDPWGGNELAVWESPDMHEWTFRRINWPSKTACTSPNSSNYLVGSPSVVKNNLGDFFMYVTVGSEVWCGKSDHPLGPWYNIIPDKAPLLSANKITGEKNTGAHCFIDEEGKAFLVWTHTKGNVNKCLVSALGADMISLVGEVKDITPQDYSGAPCMFKSNEQYYLLFSRGNYIDTPYSMCYISGESPSGPWKRTAVRKLFDTQQEGTLGPGQPAIATIGEIPYLLYHINQQSNEHKLLRQICINKIVIEPNGNQLSVSQEEEVISNADEVPGLQIEGVSSQLDSLHGPDAITDKHYGSMWLPAPDDKYPTIVLNLGARKRIMNVYMWMEYSTVIYQYLIEYSTDGEHWKIFSDKRNNQLIGAPRFDSNAVKAKYLRISFHSGNVPWYRPGIWEIKVD